MKGDLVLLGAVGAAMVAVPAAVLLWSGQPLVRTAPVTLPVSAAGEGTAWGQGTLFQPGEDGSSFRPPEDGQT